MKIYTALSFLILLAMSNCQPSTDNNVQNTDGNTPGINKKDNAHATITWVDYSSTTYHFSIPYPQTWMLREFDFGENIPVINLLPGDVTELVELPITVHAIADISFVGIYPGGYGTELPMGKAEKLTGNIENPVNFEVNNEESRVFYLENNEPWGFFIVPVNTPANWKDGFIFAQIAVDDFRTECIDKETGQLLKSRDCDPMTGDTVKRYGTVDEQQKHEVMNILQNFTFKNTDETLDADGNTKGIQVERPRLQAVIDFPLEVKGKARGSWYFEAEFSVQLQQDNKVLSEAIVKAQGNWMTSDFVPFTATLKEPGEDVKGEATLVFQNNNASGKPENDISFTLPVVLPE